MYLSNAFEMLMTPLVGLGFGHIPADPDILPQKDLAVVLEPIQDLLHVVLEQAERQLLVQLDFLLTPLLLQLPT